MRVEKKEKEMQFTPVIITLETKEEFDFLYGLVNGSPDIIKQNCNDYSNKLDHTLFNLLNDL